MPGGDCPKAERHAIAHLHKIQGLSVFEFSICWFCVRIDSKSIFRLHMNITYLHFRNIWKCNILEGNTCSLLLLCSSKMGSDFFVCCFCHFYANTNQCVKFMYKNFSVIFPGCGLQHKKGNSKFPFLEEHAVHISYRLLKMHNKINKLFFSMYVLSPSSTHVVYVLFKG